MSATAHLIDTPHIVLPYQPFPKQQEFHRSNAKYRLFGGAAGPGKSAALLFEGLQQVLTYEELRKPVDVLILRRTFSELEGSIINKFRLDVPRDLYASYNDSKHMAIFPNGSRLIFGHCQNENDIYQYQGGEYAYIGIDELTQFTLKQWMFLTSRNRCPHRGSFPNMAGATNPGSMGHAWVKALWIDKVPAPGMERPDQYDSGDYDFIRATLIDNPIYAKDINYQNTLNRLPTALRAAMLLGDWNVFAGQYYDLFSCERHVRRVEQLEMQPWWTRWISCDWGFEHPSAIYWHAMTPEGKVITYREHIQNHLTGRMLAALIEDKSVTREGRPENIAALYLSPDAYARKQSDNTIAIQIDDELKIKNVIPGPRPADNDRIGGWMLMYQLLADNNWIITENCTQLIEKLPQMIRDPDKVEDCLKVDGDDECDSARYGLKSMLNPAVKPVEARVAERIVQAEERNGKPMDNTARAMWMQTYLHEEKRKTQSVILPRRWRGRPN